MTTPFNNAPIGGTTLVRKAIKSPNYAAGSSGWSVNKDGSAEFNNLTVRGVFEGLKYEINATGMFFYSGTPANGNLVASVVPGTTGGNDQYGNAYKPGVCVYGGSGQPVAQLYVSGALPTALPKLNLLSNRTVENTPGTLVLDVVNTGAVNEMLEMNLFGPSITQRKDYATVHFQSSAKDLSNGALGTLTYVDGNGNQNFQLQWDSSGVHINSTLFGTAGTLTIGDNVSLTSGKVISADIWNTLGGQAAGGPTGWTVDHGRYRMTPEGEVEIDIMLHSTTTGNAGTIGFNNNLGAAYQPAIDRIYPLGVNSTSVTAFVHVTTAGVVTLIVPSATKLGCNIRMPLD